MKTMQKRLALALVAVLMMAMLAGRASGAPADEPAEGAEAAGSSILIACFTMPEDVDPAGADAVAGASIVVRDGEILGNVEYMARTIQQAVGGDLLRIETVEEYPLEHEALVDFAAEEQEAGARHADREPRTVRHDLPRLSQLVGRHAPGALYLPGVV